MHQVAYAGYLNESMVNAGLLGGLIERWKRAWAQWDVDMQSSRMNEWMNEWAESEKKVGGKQDELKKWLSTTTLALQQ